MPADRLPNPGCLPPAGAAPTLSPPPGLRRAGERPAVALARAYLAEHQTEEVFLRDVARAARLSPFYFCKTFRRETGLTFVDYLARLRIETVKARLFNPHVRISEAAYASGFQSLSQFNRVFRRIVGEAPTRFRGRRQDEAPVPPVAHGNSVGAAESQRLPA